IRDATVTGVQTCALPICQVLQTRPGGSEKTAGRRRLSEWISRHDVLHDRLRLYDPGRLVAARAEGPEERRYRRQDRSERVRRLHRDLLLRQVRLDDVRAADRLPGARQLSVR